jgi:hypothetical protein
VLRRECVTHSDSGFVGRQKPSGAPRTGEARDESDPFVVDEGERRRAVAMHGPRRDPPQPSDLGNRQQPARKIDQDRNAQVANRGDVAATGTAPRSRMDPERRPTPRELRHQRIVS